MTPEHNSNELLTIFLHKKLQYLRYLAYISSRIIQKDIIHQI